MKRPARWIIILFCLWHAFSVLTYSLPPDSENALLNEIRRETIPIVRPYMLATSQWQMWNLFAPNPLRRVVHYVIQVRSRSGWNTAAVLSEQTLPWWRNADELKLLRRIEDGEAYWYPVRNRYLEEFCESHRVPADTPIRLVYRYYVIPHTDFPMPLSFWRQWRPDWQQKIGAQTLCPSPL